MALGYTKEDLEKISIRLQCCAVDAAKEALTAEMFLDASKKECAWNKFKFIQKTSDVLSKYIPGGMYTYENPYEIIEVIDTNLDVSPGTGFILRDAITINDKLSPYYGLTFVLYGQPLGSDCFIFVLKEGEFFSLLGTIAYPAPYMMSLTTLVYDDRNDVLLMAGYNKIEKYNLAPLLNPSPAAPTPISITPTVLNFPHSSAYNRINYCTYFTDGFSPIVVKYDAATNITTNIDLSLVFPAAPSTIYVAVDSVVGTIWVTSGTSIYGIQPFTNVASFIVNLSSVPGINAVSIERISYSYQLNKFLIPYYNGSNYDVAILNVDGSVYSASIYYNSLPIYHAIYYQQDSEYFVASQYSLSTIVDPQYIGNIYEPRIILNETKSGKIIVCSTFIPDMPGDPLNITIIDSEDEEEPLCLNDTDVTNMLETVQHYCCDCCPNPTWSISYSPEDPFAPEQPAEPGILRTIYYGGYEDPDFYNNPIAITGLTSVNRYNYAGIYNTNTIAGYHIYYALPASMGLPNGFLDNSTNAIVAMTLYPSALTLSGIAYNVYVSNTTYPANFSLKVY
jgi:hypothetical protein